MSHLLYVMTLKSKAMQHKGHVPLMVEFTVSPDTAPYLVTSSSSTMWIVEPHPGPMVRAAVRQMNVWDLYQEILESVAAMGRQHQWGNVQPLTVAGLRAAIDHVDFYDQGPLELLIPRAHPAKEADPSEREGEAQEKPKRAELVNLMPPELRLLLEDVVLPFRTCSWVPPNTIIVVPKDRGFVGVASRVSAGKLAAVVHNAARGIAIVQGSNSDELVSRPSSEIVVD